MKLRTIGRWLGNRTGAVRTRHTSLKLFWPQPMVPWIASWYKMAAVFKIYLAYNFNILFYIQLRDLCYQSATGNIALALVINIFRSYFLLSNTEHSKMKCSTVCSYYSQQHAALTFILNRSLYVLDFPWQVRNAVRFSVSLNFV